ncbi:MULTISPECIES: hypothetical protein [unclassified Nocardia]|uniref:hypothetical protein n=1 Tax=unclassified Nocardia TaxID=2637762 RepID=UPI001CE3DC1E|nr:MULTISPECIES: hypothetical protein [unclassified Nocardia]
MTGNTKSVIGIAGGVLMVLITASVTSPAAGAQPGQGNANCHVQANNPHNSKGTPSDIVGKGTVSCNQAIDSVFIEVELQRNEGGQWKKVSGGSNNKTGPKANERLVAQATTLCAKGEYRTAARGGGVYGGVPSSSKAWEYSQSVTNPCG